MAKISTTCFVCNQVLEAPAEPKFISGGPRRRGVNLFILLQRVLELPDLRSDRSQFVHQIAFCKPCLDQLEVIKSELDEFDNLKKVVEGHVKEIQWKFRTSNWEERQAKSSKKDVELGGETQLRNQIVTGPPSRSTAMTPMEDSSKTPGVFKLVTMARTLNHLPGLGHQATPSTSRRILYSPDLQISSLPEDPLQLNGEDGVLRIAKELISSDDLGSEQRPSIPFPALKIKASHSSVGQKKQVSNDPSHSKPQITQGTKNLPTSPSTPPNKSQTVPKRNSKSNEKKHKCHTCPAVFNRKDNLTRHLRIHTGEKPFSCLICPKTFSDMSSLKEHQLVHNGKKELRCRFCSKTVARPRELKIHDRVHTGEKPFLCKMCSKTFSQSSDLVRHMRTHTQEKPYPCKICSKTFSQSNDLVRHMRTHTREEPYLCKMCLNTFSTSHALGRHMRTHTREKPYTCKMCSKTFARSSTLVVHMRVHTREKPFKCTVCSKEFAQLGHLKAHKNTQHLLVD